MKTKNNLITITAKRVKETGGLYKGYFRTDFYKPDGTFFCSIPASQRQPRRDKQTIILNSWKWAIKWEPSPPVVFDSGGETFDRYTIITESGEIYGASENPFHPCGFGQLCAEIKPEEVKKYVSFRKKSGHFGKVVKIESLPDRVQEYIKQIQS